MRADDAPDGFWPHAGEPIARVDGVRVHSDVPTRFFQTLEPYPREWGRLVWRIQINKLVDETAARPMFRTFYPGVEWNLNGTGACWVLTAWFRWDGPGAPCPDRSPNGTALVEGDTALFRYAWMPKPSNGDAAGAVPDPDRPLYLRSRVDARDRRSIAAALRAGAEPSPAADSLLIALDDFIEAPR